MTMRTSLLNLRPLALAILSQLAGLGPLALAQQVPAAPAVMRVPTEPTLDIRAYRIEGSNPLSEAQTEQLLKPFTGAERKLSQIEQAATALESALRGNGLNGGCNCCKFSALQIGRQRTQHFDGVYIVDDWRKKKCQSQEKMANTQQWLSKMHGRNIAQSGAGISSESGEGLASTRHGQASRRAYPRNESCC